MNTRIIYHSTEDKDFKKEFTKLPKSKTLVKSSSFYIEKNFFSQKIFLKKDLMGQGGFGKAYKFSEIKSNDHFLVKEIQINEDSTIESIKNEAKLFEKVNGYCVLLITDSIARLIMKNLPGKTIDKILSNNILKSQIFDNPKNSFQRCISILKGVHALHQMKVVHGDLSQRNILLNKTNVFFCDFGFARIIGEMTSGNWASDYIFAPELRSSIPAHPIQDVYSLGELLAEIIGDVNFGKYEEWMTMIIAKMTEQDPASRIQLTDVIRKFEQYELLESKKIKI